MDSIVDLQLLKVQFPQEKKILKYSETSIKQTPSIEQTPRQVPKLMSYIPLYNKPLFSGHLY